MAKKRSTIGSDPIAAQMGGGVGTDESTPQERPASRKKQATFNLPPLLIERVRNIVYWTPGVTAADIATEGIGRAVERYEAEYRKTHGKDVPQRSGPNKPGAVGR